MSSNKAIDTGTFKPRSLPGTRKYAIWNEATSSYALDGKKMLTKPSFGSAIAACAKLAREAEEAQGPRTE